MRRRHHQDEPVDANKPKKSRIERLREVLPLAWILVRPRLPALGLGLVLILFSRAAGLVLPAAARIFIDDVVSGSEPEKMRLVLVGVVAAAMVQAVCSYLLFRVLTVRTIELVADLRTQGRQREEEASRARDDITKKAGIALEDSVETILNRLNVPNKNEIEELSRKIGLLSEKVSTLDESGRS